MSDEIQYGTPKLPAPIFRIWIFRCVAVMAALVLSFLYNLLGDHFVASIVVWLIGILLLAVVIHQSLKERRALRFARRNNLNLCAICCTPFDPESVERCRSCGVAIDAREEQRRWRRAVLISLWNWFSPKPRGAKVFPHWSIPLFIGLLWFGYLFLRGSIEDWFWPPNSQTTQTFTVPNSGNPPKTYQMPTPTRPPASYVITMGLIGMLTMFGMIAYIMIRQVRVTQMLKHAAKHGFLLCERCNYPLTEIDGNKCPECGRAFDRERLRQSWYIPYGLYVQKQAFNMSIPLGLEGSADQSPKS